MIYAWQLFKRMDGHLNMSQIRRCDMEYSVIREANDDAIRNIDLSTLLKERDDEREHDECIL